MTSQPRVAPAVAMWAGIVGAAVLAILFFCNAVQRPPHSPDEWERAQVQVLENSNHNEPLLTPVPHTITLLERTSDGAFFYAAKNKVGSIMLGIVNARGEGTSCGAVGTDPEPAVSCGSWGGEGEAYIAAWVQRAPQSATGFRHELREFATEAELQAYLDLKIEAA